MEETSKATGHCFQLEDRANGRVTGVKEVRSFTENEIILDTEQGLLHVKGENLHVKRLTLEKGEVELDGLVEMIQYSAVRGRRAEGESLLAHLFR